MYGYVSHPTSSPEGFAPDMSGLMEVPFWLTHIVQQFPGTGENLQRQNETASVLFYTLEAVQCSINTPKDLVH